MFVPGTPTQPSLIFVGMAGAYPGMEQNVNIYNRLEWLATYKHSSLLQTFVNDGGKKIYNIGTRAVSYETFYRRN